MAIQVKCPNCDESYDVAEKLAGQSFECVKCASSFTVPDVPVNETLDDDQSNEGSSIHGLTWFVIGIGVVTASVLIFLTLSHQATRRATRELEKLGAEMKQGPEVNAVWLKGTQVTEGVVYLKKLPKLSKLSLSNARITNGELIHLKKLSNLRRLQFNNIQITDADLTELRGALDSSCLIDSPTRKNKSSVGKVSNDGQVPAKLQDSVKPVRKRWLAFPSFDFPPKPTTYFYSRNGDRPDIRTWTSKSGAVTVEAELFSSTDEMVTLRRTDGRKVDIPLDKLSLADRDYMRVREREILARKMEEISSNLIKHNLATALHEFTRAYRERDYKTVVSYFPDSEIVRRGGRDQAEESLWFENTAPIICLEMKHYWGLHKDLWELPISHVGRKWLAVVSTTAHLKKLDNQQFTNKLEGSLLCFSNDNGETWRFLDGNADAFANIRQQHPKLAAKITCPPQIHIIDDRALIKVDGEWIPDEKETRRAKRAILNFDHVPELEKLRVEIKRSEVGRVLGVDLEGTQITDAELVDLKGLTRLAELSLRDTQFTDAELVHLKVLFFLENLNLGNTEITDAGLVHLKTMTNLKHLDLYDTQITDAGLLHLAEMTNLELVVLSLTFVTDAGVAKLRKALPKCDIN